MARDITLSIGKFAGLLLMYNITTIDVFVDKLVMYILDNLILSRIPQELTFEYTVVEGYDGTHGKFSNALGNTAIIDCNDVLWSVMPKLYAEFQSLVEE
jgi:hypothetical protein